MLDKDEQLAQWKQRHADAAPSGADQLVAAELQINPKPKSEYDNLQIARLNSVRRNALQGS